MNTLWTPSPSRIRDSQMTQFQMSFANKLNTTFNTYSEFHQATVTHADAFWQHVIEFFEVTGEGSLEPVCGDYGFEQYTWFENYRLNFAENLLARGTADACAIHTIHESGRQSKITYGELRVQMAKLQEALRDYILPGDVVACYMPNIAETLITMLATTSLGGVFTSTSCDFGVEGVVDRFGQSKPKVMVTVNAYQYNGKTHDLMARNATIAEQLDCIEKVVIVDFLNPENDTQLPASERFCRWQDFLKPAGEPVFVRQPFQAPLYIMYSSGTTGKPKCIVHSVGGTLLQHLKELGLHSDLTAEKSILYFTTCGWMMWNWLVSSLAFGARVCLYEGSPGFPGLAEFFEIIAREEINIYGTSPKFLKALQDSGYRTTGDLPTLETILSTGAPLLPEQYDYIYKSIKSDVCVSSIAGGTDIIGCFMLGNPNLPVYRGEIQCLGLGMDVAAVNDQGEPLIAHEGELVCRKSFPSRPIYFLNDQNNERINSAYFERFKGMWHHGDFIKITDRGSVIVYGRSDATLNPGGVRIGTAEIYRQTELLPWLEDSLCVGRPADGDVDVVLFVKLQPGEVLTEARITEIRQCIKNNTTPRHMPRFVWQVADIPYTRSGKKMELAISRILASRPLTNLEAVANPDCLAEYQQYQLKPQE